MLILKRLSFAVFVITGIVLLLHATRMDYVPTANHVKSHPAVAPFLVEPENIEGIYGNLDVGSIVFRYTAETEDVTETIRERANGAGWSPIGDPRFERIGELRFERIDPKSKYDFCSSEEVRIRLDGNKVWVAWVQGDTADNVESFSETPEAKWADENIWWRLER